MTTVMEAIESTNFPQQVGKAHAAVVASLKDTTKRYNNGVVALDGLSLELRQGEIVAVLGPNGAGKSTAVKLMLGLSSPTSGSVQVFGADPRDSDARMRTGAMLQVGKAPEMLRVREHITMFRGYYPRPMAFADIVHAAGLEGIENRMFGELSGGQKQRVLFGLALAGDPDLIFLDEPTVGLDIEARRGLWTQIRSLAARGKTVLLTTHYLEEADALAHRIIVVNKGRVICEGTPAEVKAMGAGALSKGSAAESDAPLAAAPAAGLKIIRCVTKLSAAQVEAMTGVSRVEVAATHTTITSAEPEATLREMFAQDAEMHSLEVQSPALEDAFLALTSNHS